MKNYFNTIKCNNGLWIILQKVNLEFLLSKAKDLERKYEWLQAAELYKKASKILFKEKDFVKAAEFQEKLEYSFFRASLQANLADARAHVY